MRSRLCRELTTVRGSLLFCLLSGAVFSLPYFWEWAFPLTYLSLISLFRFLTREPLAAKPFRAIFCFCLGFRFPVCLWLSELYPLDGFGFSALASVLIVAFCCIGIPLLHALVYAAILQCGRFLPSRPLLLAFGYGALWTVAEAVLSVGELAFPWGTVALSQTGFPPLLQTVSVFGTYGLTFLVVSFCALVSFGAVYRRRSVLITGIALFSALLTVGTVLLFLPVRETGTVSVAAVQGNVSMEDKWSDTEYQTAFSVYANLTEQAAQNGADVILLPESAVAVDFDEGGILHETFAEIATAYDCTVIIGVLRAEEDGTHNSVVAVLPDGSLSGYYDKQHPVPFGECMPYKNIFGVLFPSLSQFHQGGERVAEETEPLLRTDLYDIGCFICYDSVFNGKVQASADADFYAVPTNDSWFGNSSGIRQHLRYSKLRAVEGGKYLLRAGNTGISAIIDSKGRIIAQTDPLEQTVLYGEIQTNHTSTAYRFFGDFAVWLSALYPAVLFLCKISKRLTKSARFFHKAAV